MLAAAALLIAIGGSAAAAATKVFRQTTAKDFEEGEATGSMILPTGEVVAGMKTNHVAIDAAFAWCAAPSRDGQQVFFGTGDQGKIFAVDTKAPRTGDERPARKVADLDAAWVTALAVRNDGTLLAGTTPGGRIYTVDPKSGTAHDWVTLAADHVWSLIYDPRTGVTYAGTGSPGKVFAIDDKGKARELWDSGDKHVVSLAQDPVGARPLLAGTSEEAILYRIGLDGRSEALQDFEAEEVRAIAPAPDAIYVAVNDFEKSTPPVVSPGPAAAKGTRITQTPATAPASAGSLPRPGQRKAKAGLYRLERDGRIEQIFSLADGYLTSVLADGTLSAQDGSVHVATGTQGKVYRILGDRTAALALDLPERQVLTLIRAASSFLAGTGDVGGVYRALPSAGEDASYLSKVLDGEFHARWGMLRWHGSRALTVETRSGNTAKPDASWNGWKKLDRLQPGNDESAGHVASAGARYLQYRVGLVGTGARLRDVSVYYVPQNQRARVTELTLADAPAPTTGTPPPRAHSALLRLRWKVDNTDGDDLAFRLAFREENETVWRPLAGPDPLQKAEYDWNTEAIPDGLYTVQVVTSDERSRPRGEALESTFVSPPLLVDNRKPEIVGLEARYPQISGRARDTGSNITEVEFAVDGGDWQLVPPSDGIFDDRVEPFGFRLPALAPGPHTVTVRAWDGADNVGAAAITVRGPGK
ncbi:MAG TPA: hypothetical protein VFH68_17415 [Polyangia bacterium]|jgi:hypothetical protein|nr:hypothetical protein [Polyangia bacterium]